MLKHLRHLKGEEVPEAEEKTLVVELELTIEEGVMKVKQEVEAEVDRQKLVNYKLLLRLMQI